MWQAKPRILVAQIGARRRYAVPLALHRAGMLGLFVTDAFSDDLVGRLAKVASRFSKNVFVRKLAEREIPEIPAARIKSFPWFGLRRRVMAALSHSGSVRSRHARDNETFGRLTSRLPLKEFDAVYVFNGAGLEIAQAAKERGLKVILDQTSAPIRVEEGILEEERKRWPGWEKEETIDPGWQALAEREECEWQLADLIICGSDYVRECLVQSGIAYDKIEVVPTGYRQIANERPNRNDKRGLKRVLWAGTVCLRKGAPYFARAAQALCNELTFLALGNCSLTNVGLQYFSQSVDYRGPVPHSVLLQEYRKADVFVLPSLSEGSAAVCYEALAAGVPIITTPNSGSVVRDGIEGFIIPARSAEAIVGALERLRADPELLDEMRKAAFRRATEFTWESYQSRLPAAIEKIFS